MSKEMVISANRHETRVALLEDDQLVEVYFQRANEYSLAGSIHKGRVTRVLPGMQSAFVDLGIERDTFLYVSDFLEEHEDIERVTEDERPARTDRGRDRDRDRRPPQPVSSQPPEPTPPLVSVPPPSAAVEAPSGLRPPGPPGSGVREERGDRRGRRSRRRNRGRGFPESKYAAEPSAAAGPAPADAPTPEAAVELKGEPQEEIAPESARLILPGESLAKYRGAPQSPSTPPPLPAEASLPDLSPAIAPEAEENEFNEPIHYPPDNVLPDAPAHRAGTLTPEAPPFPAAAAPAEPEAELETGPETGQEAEPDDDASGPAVAPMLDEDEDLDIQAMILGQVEVDEPEEVEGDEVEGGAEQAFSSLEPGVEADVAGGLEAGIEAGAEGGPGPAPAEPESGTAEVRERGGRYPHRGSRRLRRRSRGPQTPGGRDPARSNEPRSNEPRPLEQAGESQAGPDSHSEPHPESGPAPAQERTVSRPAAPPQPSISDLLKEGQEIIVQIAKEPLGQKGARITSHIALPGRYVVYMPTLEHMGVSRKISSDEERLRLKRILLGRRPGPAGGFITRTAAEGRTEEEIAGDMEFLYKLWQDIRAKAERKPAPLLLHHDLDIVQRVLRDQLTDNFKAIWIDNEESYENIVSFVQRFQPGLVGKVKLYTREAPIFDAFGITAELEKALRPKVWLKSGGYIVINQTEALVAIDVNTGKYVGKSNRLEDTIVKTNTEAIKEIVRQVRLRDLGGIIVIDFIDMDERKNRQKVMQTLEEAMRADRAPYKILQFNDFGLVAITRKRVKQSLERTLCSPCPHCEGAGYIKSVQTVVSEILTEARKMAGSVEGKDVMLRAHPDVAKVLKSNHNKYLEELEEVLRRPVMVKSDPLLHHEKFDLA